jgi:hypothetical protein
MVRENRPVILRLALALVLAALAVLVPAQARAEPRPEARFDVVTPVGATPAFRDFAVDQDGFTYVLWPGLVQKYSPAGALLTTWGGFGSAPGQFHPPYFNESTNGIAADSLGHVFVADGPGDRVVEFTSGGAFVANIGGLEDPSDVAVDESNNLLVNDSNHIRRLAQDGTVLASWFGGFLGVRPGPGNRVYIYSGWAVGNTISWVDGADFGTEGSFPLLFGDFPDEKGNSDPSCCGLAFLQGRLWIGRSMIKDIEAYGPGGGLVAACPAPDYIYDMIAGRDGRLYVSDGRGVIRYVNSALPCDTEQPRVTSIRLSGKVLHISSYRRLRNSWLSFGASKQSEATLTLTRLVEGRRVGGRCVRAKPRNRRRPACVRRRVTEATYDAIPVSLTDAGSVRFADLFWHDRPPLGRYELSITVKDRNGMTSAPRATRLRLTR